MLNTRVVVSVPIEGFHFGARWVVSGTDHGVSFKPLENLQRLPVDLNSAAGQVVLDQLHRPR